MSLVDRVYAGKNNFRLIVWPGSSLRVKMRILSRGEILEAQKAAHEHFKLLEISPDELHNVEPFEDEKTVQILYRCLASAEGEDEGKPVADGIDSFRMSLNRLDQNALVNEYELLEDECAPNVDRMSEKQLEAFIDTLKKKPDETLSSVRDIGFARRLLRSLVGPPQS